MSRREWDRDGRVPLHTLRADIDYGQTEAKTTFGQIGVSVWIYRGEFAPLQPVAAPVIEVVPATGVDSAAPEAVPLVIEAETIPVAMEPNASASPEVVGVAAAPKAPPRKRTAKVAPKDSEAKPAARTARKPASKKEDS